MQKLLVVLCAMLVSSCMVREIKPLPKVNAVQATQQIPADELFDVAVQEFDAGIPTEIASDETALDKRRIYPDVRRAESRVVDRSCAR